jgi:phosphoglycolate phosphatase
MFLIPMAVRRETDTLLFDLDGTLTDSRPGIVRSVRYALKSIGVVPPGEDTLGWCAGPPLRQNFARLLPGADAATIERAVDLYRERYDAVGYLENEVYAGVLEMLSALGRDRKLLVVTGKYTESAEKVVEAFALRAHFAEVFGSRRDGTFTDKGRLIAHVMERHRLTPESLAFVGDREHDMLGAREHRIFAVGVSYGYGSIEELVGAGADVICATPSAVVRAFT